MPPTLSVIIPTRNERENVPRLVEALGAALAETDYELIFVDDSTDGTDAVLADLARANPRLTVHHRDGGGGLASAVADGIGLARGEVIGVMDADLQHPPSLLPALLRRMEETGADLVVASRYLPGAGRPGLSPFRRLVSRGTRLLAWVLLGGARRSSDPLSGCFIARRGVLEGVTLRPLGFKILLEVLVRGRYGRLAEVPYVFEKRHRGQTKASLRQGVTLLRHIALLTATSPGDARLWKFLMVGASGVAVNMTVFWLLIRPLRVHYLAAGVVAGLVSTCTNFLLNNAYTWADRRERGLSVFLQRMGKYYVATWAGYLVYLAVLGGLAHLGLPPMLANLMAIGVGGMLNYVMHNLWTWRRQATRPS
ncbi:MAG: glycosyltransferase family 2 protein [Armatimonadota bacterium]|nr:glycosyltransferase family 2 protein [Armatimonadota bacterium]